jgi:hypothetical protein
MASPVPYSPFPTVTPRDIPTPTVREDTPLASFGGETAQAISALGQTTEGAGKEIFARGLAMQQLNREAAANESTANWMTQAGVKLEHFTTLRGKAATDGQDAFVADLNQTREDAKAQLRDPYSQLLFDQETRRMQSYLIMSAARHAGNQNTEYVLGGLKASNDASDVRTQSDPANEEAFQADLERKRKNLDTMSSVLGWPQGRKEIEWAVLKNDSYASRLQSIAKTQPFTARQMADNAITAGDLTGKAADDTLDYIDKLKRSVGSRMSALEIHSGDNLKFGASILPFDRAKAGITAVEGGDYNRVITIKDPDTGLPVDILGAYQVKKTNLAPWLKEAGMPNMSAADFIKNHDAQDQLFRFKFVEQFQRDGGSFNAAATKWFTGSFTPPEGVEDKFHTTVPKYLASANAGLARSASITELQSIGDRRAEEQAPGDEMYHQQLLNNIVSIRQKDTRVQKVKEQENYATVYDAFHKEAAENKIVLDFDKIIHSSPEVESAYHAMSTQDQDKFQKNVIAVNNTRGKNTSQAVMHEAVGLYYGSDADRQEFLKLNPPTMPLSIPDMNRIYHMQKVLQGGDVTESDAMKYAQPQLDAVGIQNYDAPTRNRFRGALMEGIRDWKGQHPEKAMTPEDVQVITTRLLSQQLTGDFGFFGGAKKDFLFNLPIPAQLLERIKKDNPDIDDAELERMRQQMVHDQFQALQKSKTQAQR